VRHALLLPHLDNAKSVRDFDYPVETCCVEGGHTKRGPLTDEAMIVDLHGCHARSNCPNSKDGTHFAHNELKYACQAAAASAGLSHGNEPTHTALLNKLGPARLERLFPKHSSKASADLSCSLISKIYAAETLPSSERPAARGEVERELLQIEQPSSGLRLDCNIFDPKRTIKPQLIDCVSVHPCAVKNHTAEYALALKRASFVEENPQEPLPQNLRSSPSLKAAERRKTLRYRPLMQAIKEEIDAGIRHGEAPDLVPLVVSTMGHVRGLGTLKKVLKAGALRRLKQLGPRDDGQPAETLVAEFLWDFRSSLIVATQRGLAKSMLCAGLPYTRRRMTGAAVA